MGHACYELSEELFLDKEQNMVVQVSYGIRQMFDKEIWNGIGCVEDMEGSRIGE